MKKIISCVVLITVVLQLFVLPFSVNADVADKFTVVANYSETQFNDVQLTDWFYPNVKLAYELGLMKGTGEKSFNPSGNITIAETVVLACRLHSIYYNGTAEFGTGEPWFQPYVDYAVSSGIIGSTQYKDYGAYATRAQFASILAAAFPDSELAAINNIAPGAIPDVSSSAQYSGAVYKLYNAGILTGNDSKGTFAPQSNIQRSAVAAIATRMTDTSLRQRVSFGAAGTQVQPEVKVPEASADGILTAEQISEKCSDAVFYLECYGFNGEFSHTGSGFFISADGLAVTNFHVIANTRYCVVYTNDGTPYDNVEIIDVNEERDLALLKVGGEGFPCVNLSNAATVKQGQKVYAIGSPLGFDNTMTEGIVSNPNRVMNGVEVIQLSAPIDHGSSGGVLLNEYGVVVGVTSSGIDGSQADLNFAIPIKYVSDLNIEGEPIGVAWKNVYYPGFDCVLDFGAFCGADLLRSENTITEYLLVYDMDDFHNDPHHDEATNFALSVVGYQNALLAEGMTTNSNYYDDELIYTSEFEEVSIHYDSINREVVIYAETAPVVYEDFPDIPDFGWCSGIPMSEEPYVINDTDADTVIYTYRWSDYYTLEEFEELMFDYFDLVEAQGHIFMEYKPPAFYYIGKEYHPFFEFRERDFIVGMYIYK